MKMRYEYRRGIQKPKRWWVTLPVTAAIVGVYTALNAMAPAIPIYASSPDETAKKLTATKPALNENRLYVPKINLNITTLSDGSDEPSNGDAIQRSSQSGNPKDGGNYVLSAHRFQLGYTPQQTRAKSPFYHLDQLGTDDEVYVDYEGVRYAFKVTERKFVDPTDPQVEAKTDKDQLTLYSSEITGPGATREIVVAEPVGTIVWVGGAPKLKAL